MVATPIRPGTSYRITGSGLDLVILAAHPCDALCVALRILGGL